MKDVRNDSHQYYFISGFFKREAQSANFNECMNALRQVKAVETELLDTMRKQQEQCIRENANMQKAIDKFLAMKKENSNLQ